MATLQILGIDEIILLDQMQMGIGRAPDNEIPIDDESVSVYHSLITIRSITDDDSRQEYIIEDLDSTNHTYVNNKESKKHSLKEGDIIRVGNTRLKFSTKEYSPPPQKEFDKTTKINPKHMSSFLYKR